MTYLTLSPAVNFFSPNSTCLLLSKHAKRHLQRIKSTGFATGLMILCACLSSRAQNPGFFPVVKKNGVTIAPIPAFKKDKEFHAGFERTIGQRSALDIDIGIQFQYKKDPHYTTYDRQTFVRESDRLCYKNGFFLVFGVPIPTSEDCDGLVEELTVSKEEFVRFHTSANIGYKWFIIPLWTNHMLNGFYLTPGITLRYADFIAYKQAEGKVYDRMVTGEEMYVSEGLPILAGFYGTVVPIHEKEYDAAWMKKETFSKFYFNPSVQLGLQLPLGKRFTADAAFQFIRTLNTTGSPSKTSWQCDLALEFGYRF